ncbi:MAG: hypothetical protein IPJ98_04255 [Bryobacterales bacterium]|nr:hypothetical protein [Bryobacterales bacterium]
MTKPRRRTLREATWLLAASVLLTLLWVVECVRMLVGSPHAFSGWPLLLSIAAVILTSYPFFIRQRWSKAGLHFPRWPSIALIRPRWLQGMHLIPPLLGLVCLLLLLREDLGAPRQSGSDQAIFLLMLANSIGFMLDFNNYRRWLLRLP